MANSEDKTKIRSLPPISPRPKSGKTAKMKTNTPEIGDSSSHSAISDKPRRSRRMHPTAESLDSTGSVKTVLDDIDDRSFSDKPLKPRKKKVPTSETDTIGKDNSLLMSHHDIATDKPTRNKKRTQLETFQNSENETEVKVEDDNQIDSEPIVAKKKPRKKKRVVKTSTDDDYPDSGFAAELTSIDDDVIDEGMNEESSETNIHPAAVTTTILKSVPTSKLFIETDSGFKGEKKSRVAKHLSDEKPIELIEQEVPKCTTLDFALSVHRVMLSGSLFIHGVTAGIALWHIVIVYILSASTAAHILVLYEPLAQPVQCMFYLLFALCTISAMDRSDVGHMTRRFFVSAITLQSGAPAVLLYFVALVLSLGIVGVEDQMNIWRDLSYKWVVNKTAITLTSDFTFNIQIWRNVNTARGVAAILGWLVLSIVPKYDRLSKNLKAQDNVIHAVDVYP